MFTPRPAGRRADGQTGGWRAAASAIALCLLAVPLHAAATGTDPKDRSLLHRPVEFVRNLLGKERPAVVRSYEAQIGAERTGLSFTLIDDRTLDIALVDGAVLVDDRTVGHYFPGGALHSSWQDLVYEATRHPTSEVVELASHWDPAGLADDEGPAAERIRSRLSHLAQSPQQPAPPRAVPPPNRAAWSSPSMT